MASEDMDRYNRLFDLAPQAHLLSESQRLRFVKRVKQFDAERLEDFYIPRLRGFGGSEIGAVIGSSFGEFNPFTSKRKVVAGKLLIQMPEDPSGDCLRGIALEPITRDMFRNQTQCRPLLKELEALATFNHPKHPWLVGNPDDLVEINGRNILVDYKSPNDASFVDTYDRDGVSFDYAAQLHHYAILARAAGIRIDGLILCSLDGKNWSLDLRQVELNNAMFEAIETLGHETWYKHVMTGELPLSEFNRLAPLDLKDPQNAGVASKVEILTMLKTVATESTKAVALIEEGLVTELTERNAVINASHRGAEVKTKEKPNEEAVLLALQRYELNPEDFQKVVNDEKKMLKQLKEAKVDPATYQEREGFDVQAALKKLEELGEEPESFNTHTYGVALSRAKSGPQFENLEETRNLARTLVNKMLSAKQRAIEERMEEEAQLQAQLSAEATATEHALVTNQTQEPLAVEPLKEVAQPQEEVKPEPVKRRSGGPRF